MTTTIKYIRNVANFRFVIFAFIIQLVLINCSTKPMNIGGIKYEAVEIVFLNDGSKEQVLIIKEKESVELFIKQNNAQKDLALSKKYNSDVYIINSQFLLEYRSNNRPASATLYKNEAQLFKLRSVSFYKRESDAKYGYYVWYDEYLTTHLFSRLGNLKPIKTKDDARYSCYQLNDGQVLVFDKRIKDSTVYNNIEAAEFYGMINQIEIDPDDIELTPRNSKLYITSGDPLLIELISQDSFLVQQTREIGKGTFQDPKGKIYELYKSDAGVYIYKVFASESDYKRQQINRSVAPETIVLCNGKNRGCVRSVTVFANIKNDCRLALSQKLRISEKELNYSVSSLRIIDDEISKHFTDTFLVKSIIDPLANYVGEVIIREKHGTIEYEKKTNALWLPYAKLKNGNRIDFMIGIFNEFDGSIYTGDFSSESFVIGALLVQ